MLEIIPKIYLLFIILLSPNIVIPGGMQAKMPPSTTPSFFGETRKINCNCFSIPGFNKKRKKENVLSVFFAVWRGPTMVFYIALSNVWRPE
ncbi:hypothetical protein BX661DRAFT_181503, partial [Kickxella alabastrina]|uniref:uncharacterized protein n=1 Tax=Kickxella alabastrina TaxID=61397 RepID=UPI00221F066F